MHTPSAHSALHNTAQSSISGGSTIYTQALYYLVWGWKWYVLIIIDVWGYDIVITLSYIS